ncbi:MAG TPA: hypothetical protein VGG06_13320 [Thermoanaerobaculia bacterium]|jgi:hypothetical protein
MPAEITVVDASAVAALLFAEPRADGEPALSSRHKPGKLAGQGLEVSDGERRVGQLLDGRDVEPVADGLAAHHLQNQVAFGERQVGEAGDREAARAEGGAPGDCWP